jgi:hypothetical protein
MDRILGHSLARFPLASGALRIITAALGFTAFCSTVVLSTIQHVEAQADIVINATYSCRLTTSPPSIVRKTKALSAKQARAEVKKLSASVTRLRQALRIAKTSGSKVAVTKAKARVNTARTLLGLVRGCLAGNLVMSPATPTPTPPASGSPGPIITPTPGPTVTPTVTPTTVVPFPLVSRGGTYNGTWTNTTFATSGPISVVLSLPNPTSFSLTLDLGGNVFGGADPGPETFTGTFVGAAPYVFTYTSPLFGPTTRVTVDTNGDYQLDAPTPSSAVIRNFTLSLDFNDTNGSAVGMYTLSAMGMPVTGTVNTTRTQ